jgi:small subunit ribosomal protein S14
MAKTALVNKANATPKFKVRAYTRCQKCGRPHSVYKQVRPLPHLPSRDGTPR